MIAGVLFNNRRHADERNVAVAPSVNRWASGTHALSPLKTLGPVSCMRNLQMPKTLYLQTLAITYRIKIETMLYELDRVVLQHLGATSNGTEYISFNLVGEVPKIYNMYLPCVSPGQVLQHLPGSRTGSSQVGSGHSFLMFRHCTLATIRRFRWNCKEKGVSFRRGVANER